MEAAAEGAVSGRGVVVVGPGRVGLSLAAALAGTGRAVQVRGRSPTAPGFLDDLPDVTYGRGVGLGRRPGSAEPAASDPPRSSVPESSTSTVSPREPLPDLIFAVPDDRLPGVAGEWAEALAAAGSAAGGGGEGEAPGRRGDTGDAAAGASGAPPVALHTSGVHPADVLSPLRGAGYRVAAWHPLTSVARPGDDVFYGVTFGVAGDPGAVRRGRALAREVGGGTVTVSPDGHVRYHAAAVFASNFLAACLGMAAEELRAATDGEGGLRDLLPLARAAVENLADAGVPEGITGPVARGDAETVRRHLEAVPPGRRELYRGLARELLALVEERLDPEAADAVRRELEG